MPLWPVLCWGKGGLDSYGGTMDLVSLPFFEMIVVG